VAVEIDRAGEPILAKGRNMCAESFRVTLRNRRFCSSREHEDDIRGAAQQRPLLAGIMHRPEVVERGSDKPVQRRRRHIVVAEFNVEAWFRVAFS